MKIMTSMYALKEGGAYDRFMMMVEAFLENRCEVHCLSLVPILFKHPSYHNHIMVFPFQRRDGWVAKSVILLFFPIYGLLMGWREKIDLFVAFGPRYAFLQALPKWILKRPMVTLIRLDLSLRFKKEDLFNFVALLNRVIEYIGLLLTERIIAVNTAIRKEVIETIGRWKKVEVEILFNNIPKMKRSPLEDILRTRNHLGIPKGTKIFVTAGVLTPRKNIEILLKSVSKFGLKNWLLVVVGDRSKKQTCSYINHLKELTKKLNLEGRVIFTGWCGKEEFWNILSASDLFVLPSLKEGMPNVMLEALGAELPCLGSNISGIRDILQYEILMFDPLDEEILGQKINRFFSERDFSDHISSLCFERKQKFFFDWKTKAFEMITKTSS